MELYGTINITIVWEITGEFMNSWIWDTPFLNTADSLYSYIDFIRQLQADLLATQNVCPACVNLDPCPLHNMATWIHHLLTKVQ